MRLLQFFNVCKPFDTCFVHRDVPPVGGVHLCSIEFGQQWQTDGRILSDLLRPKINFMPSPSRSIDNHFSNRDVRNLTLLVETTNFLSQALRVFHWLFSARMFVTTISILLRNFLRFKFDFLYFTLKFLNFTCSKTNQIFDVNQEMRSHNVPVENCRNLFPTSVRFQTSAAMRKATKSRFSS